MPCFFPIKRAFSYRCFVEGCWLQKKQGTRGLVSYRNYCVHMGSQHGVLERIMESDYRYLCKKLIQKNSDKK